MTPRPALFPRLRWVAVAWLLVWVPTYWDAWGWRNFLQLCDIAVVLTCVGLWRGDALLLSTQALSSIVVDVLWTLDLAWRLTVGRPFVGGTEYMLDAGFPLVPRLMSLFHVAWPPLLLWALRRTGYDRRALAVQAGIAVVSMTLVRLVGDPAKNMNFVFRDPIFGRAWGPAPAHLALSLAVLIVVVYLPTHLALKRLYRPGGRC